MGERVDWDAGEQCAAGGAGGSHRDLDLRQHPERLLERPTLRGPRHRDHLQRTHHRRQRRQLATRNVDQLAVPDDAAHQPAHLLHVHRQWVRLHLREHHQRRRDHRHEPVLQRHQRRRDAGRLGGHRRQPDSLHPVPGGFHRRRDLRMGLRDIPERRRDQQRGAVRSRELDHRSSGGGVDGREQPEHRRTVGCGDPRHHHHAVTTHDLRGRRIQRDRCHHQHPAGHHHPRHRRAQLFRRRRRPASRQGGRRAGAPAGHRSFLLPRRGDDGPTAWPGSPSRITARSPAT